MGVEFAPSCFMEQRLQQGESRSPEAVTTASETRSVPDGHEITQWLTASQGGDPAALEKLLPLVYDQLHRQALRFFARERAGHTLQPTALVNEVYLRLVKEREATWLNRAQFFAVAA